MSLILLVINKKNAEKEQWAINDGLLTSWLLCNMKEVQSNSMTYGGDTTFSIWNSNYDQLLPNNEDSETDHFEKQPL